MSKPGQPSRPKGGRFTLLALMVLILGFGPVSLVLAGDIYNGEKLYQRYCQKCHNVDGRGSMPGTPDFTWRGGPRNGLHQPDATVVRRILKGGRICPAFRGIVSDPEVMDLVSFLRTLHMK